MPTSTPQDNPPSPPEGLSNAVYNSNVPPTPDSAAAFNNPMFTSDLLDWSDLASWGQFEGLVTAGNGMYDRGLLGDDGDFQVDFGLG